MRAPRAFARVVLVAVATFGFAACDSDGDGQPDIDVTLPGGTLPGAGSGGEGTDVPAPEPTDAPEPAPEPTDAPEPAPEPTVAPETSDEGNGDETAVDGDSTTGVWLVLLGLVAVGVILAMIVGSRRRTAGAAGTERQRELVATAAWIHDQLTLEVLAMPPGEAQRRWAIERSRVDQLGIDGRIMATDGYREMWEQLGVILAQLSGSIDTALRVGAIEGADPSLVAEAARSADRQRAELGAWVATARTLV